MMNSNNRNNTNQNILRKHQTDLRKNLHSLEKMLKKATDESTKLELVAMIEEIKAKL